MTLSLDDFFLCNPIFKDVSNHTREYISKMALYRTLEPGQILFQHGDAANSLYFILGGDVSVCLFANDGRQLGLNVVYEGNLLGEIAVLDDGPRSASAIAIAQCQIASIASNNFRSIIKKDQQLSQNIINFLCAQIRRVSNRIIDANALNLESSIARILIEAGQNSTSGSSQKKIVRIKQEEIGFIAGVSRVTINKYLNNWARKGIVTITRGKIIVENIDTLFAIIDDDRGKVIKN